MTGNKRQHAGFTLIEMLVVVASFSVVFLVATTVYSNSFRQQKKVQTTQRVTADSRYLVETMARSVRTGMVDYDYYADDNCTNAACDLSAAQTTLAIKPQDNSNTCAIRYSISNGKITTSSSSDCSTFDMPVDITPNDITVNDFHVYISPRSDPFAASSQPVSCNLALTDTTTYANSGCLADQWCCPSDTTTCHPETPEQTGAGVCINANTQPTVTIVITSTASNGGITSQSTIQTSVASRIYVR